MSLTMTMPVPTICFHIEIIFILKAIKFQPKVSYGKQTLKLMVISYETCQRLTSYISDERTTCVRSIVPVYFQMMVKFMFGT